MVRARKSYADLGIDRLREGLGYLFSGALMTLGFDEFDQQSLHQLGVLVLGRAAAQSLLLLAFVVTRPKTFSGKTPEQALSRGWAIGGLITTVIVSMTTRSIVAPGSIRYF